MSVNELPPLPDAIPASDRGFLLYGGSSVQTSRGHVVRVQESSSAEGPHVWLFTDPDGDPHLSLADAIEIRDRLTQFIDSVEERWGEGRRYMEEARRMIAERRAFTDSIGTGEEKA